jgi:hypothetical protein
VLARDVLRRRGRRLSGRAWQFRYRGSG